MVSEAFDKEFGVEIAVEKIALSATKKEFEGHERYVKDVFDSFRYSLFAGGKRLRPAMVMLSADAVRPGASEDVFEAALALEWLHTYTLVHDDIMDGDSLRRGEPTVHTVFGEATAILAGDSLHADAFEHICRVKNCEDRAKLVAVQMLAHASHELCEGQQKGED